eukprot:scaffold132459_cov31-Tisochrysis_lutea.AAC.2
MAAVPARLRSPAGRVSVIALVGSRKPAPESANHGATRPPARQEECSRSRIGAAWGKWETGAGACARACAARPTRLCTSSTIINTTIAPPFHN